MATHTVTVTSLVGSLTYSSRLAARFGLKALYRRASDAIEADTFDAKADSHLSVTTLSVRWEAWEEITGILDGALRRVLEIQGKESVCEDDAERFSATIGLLGFESPQQYE